MKNKEEYFRFPTQALETADMDPGCKRIKKFSNKAKLLQPKNRTNVVSSVGYCTEEWFPFPLGCLERVIMNGDY